MANKYVPSCHADAETARLNKPELLAKDGKPVALKLLCVTVGDSVSFVWHKSPSSAIAYCATANGYSCVAVDKPARKTLTPIDRVTKSLDKLTPEEKAALVAQLLGQTSPAAAAPAQTPVAVSAAEPESEIAAVPARRRRAG